MAASNDLKGSQSLADGLHTFISDTPADESASDFRNRFNTLLAEQQQNLSIMEELIIKSQS